MYNGFPRGGGPGGGGGGGGGMFPQGYSLPFLQGGGGGGMNHGFNQGMMGSHWGLSVASGSMGVVGQMSGAPFGAPGLGVARAMMPLQGPWGGASMAPQQNLNFRNQNAHMAPQNSQGVGGFLGVQSASAAGGFSNPRFGAKAPNPFDEFFAKPFRFSGNSYSQPNAFASHPNNPPNACRPNNPRFSNPNSANQPRFVQGNSTGYNSGGGGPAFEQNQPRSAPYLPPPPPPPPSLAEPVAESSSVRSIDYGHGRNQFNDEQVDRALNDILNYPGTGNVANSSLPNIQAPQVSKRPEDAFDAYGANIEREMQAEREKEERRRRALPIPRGVLRGRDQGNECEDRPRIFDSRRDSSPSRTSGRNRRSRSPPASSRDKGADKTRPTPPVPKATPPPPPPPPKAETVMVDSILCDPGRKRRPRNIAIIVRGPPGAGKSHLAKLIKEKEQAESSSGATAPRILSIDDFFSTDVETMERNPKTGKMVKKTSMVYEYDADMEPAYYKSLLKMFKKNVEQGFFPFLVVDAVFQKVAEFEEFWSFAKSKGFQVYVVELVVEAGVCVKRNVHGRTAEELSQICANWVKTPDHMIKLDIRTLLQEDDIQEVEMEDAVEEEEKKEEEKKGEKINEGEKGDTDDGDDDDEGNADENGDKGKGKRQRADGEEDEEEDEGCYFRKVIRSKWDGDVSETNLDLLDGLSARRRRHTSAEGDREKKISMQDFLEAEIVHRPVKKDGKKRVRWADIEEMRSQERKQAIGFVVGQSVKDWEQMTETGAAEARGALRKTRFIPHREDDTEVVLE